MWSKHKYSVSTPESSRGEQRNWSTGPFQNQSRHSAPTRGRLSPQPGPSTPDTSRPRTLHLQADESSFAACIQPLKNLELSSESSTEDSSTQNRPHGSPPSRILLQLQDIRERFILSPDIPSFKAPKGKLQQPVRRTTSSTAIPDTSPGKLWCQFSSDLDQDDVSEYLDKNVRFTHEYIVSSMNLDEIEQLYFLKIELELNKSCASQHETRRRHFGNSEYMDILRELSKGINEEDFILKLAEYLNVALQGYAFKVYKINGSIQDPVKVFTIDEVANKIVLVKSKPHIQVVEAARRASCMYATRICEPLLLYSSSQSVFHKRSNTDELNNAMVVPILVENGKVSHVIEVWRNFCYQETDVQVADSFMVWGSLANRYCTIMKEKKKDSELTDFLLMTVKSIFEEMVSLDQVIKRILQFAQKLVDADRASLFLVDYKNRELVSTVFDLKLSNPGNDQDSKEKKEIRMPITRGIAGHVAITGDYVNISDAYSDKRFNREVDEATGYKTTSILCMPVKIEGIIIGVVQMVNKRDAEKFCHEDVKSFKVFASFFGLALHHARLYDKIARKEQKYKVALEVLSYHNTCRESEVEELAVLESHLDPFTLSDYYLDPFALNMMQKCRSAMIMFDDLFNMKNFENLDVTRFILTVKKNYRDVPYHNFHHGWSVAQTMYAILKSDSSKHFSYTQRLALFVASLCHDLDHRGYTNKYMSETASPLAAMYTTSTLEHHHFNITVTILQQDGHNIFSRFSSNEYKDILGLIRTCILATDLAAFFPNLVQMKELCSSDKWSYNWKDLRHRELAMAMSMTAADLSASAKPWDVQNKTVKVIFEEFYSQGDKERAAGKTPIPMMDRNQQEEQPASQVGFLTQICLPCYQILEKILPTTADLHKMACNNLKIWEQKAEEVAKLTAKQPELSDQQNKDVSLGSLSSDSYESGRSGIQNTEIGEIIPWDEEANLTLAKQEITSVATINEEDSWIEADASINISKQ